MRAHVIGEQALLESVDSRSRLLCNLLQTNPNQDGTGNMIALDARFTTLGVQKALSGAQSAVRKRANGERDLTQEAKRLRGSMVMSSNNFDIMISIS